MRDRLGNKLRLQHILEAIHAIENYTNGVTQADFASNPMRFDATVRNWKSLERLVIAFRNRF